MENKSNEELLKELEKSLIWMSIKTEQNKYDEVDKLQEKVDKLKAEILSRMKDYSMVKNRGFEITVEELEEKLNEAGMIAFRCNDVFIGTYKAEREDNSGKYMEIYSAGETFLLCDDKEINTKGDVYYRINDTKGLFYEGMVLRGSIVRGINNGVLEEIDYEKPEIAVYNIDELSTATIN